MLSRILKKSNAADRVTEIAAKLEAARQNLAEAEADETAAGRVVDAAMGAREVASLDPDEGAYLQAEEAVRLAVLRHNRAATRLEAARANLAETEDADRRAKTEAEHRRLLAENAALADRVTTFLATTTDAARTLIGDLHQQRENITRFNSSAPDDLRVVDPEAFRGTPTVPEEVMAESEGFMWFKEGTTTPIADQEHVRQNADGRTGWAYVPGGSLSVERRKVLRAIVRPRVPGASPPPLAEQMAIPALGLSLRPGWEPTRAHDVADTLRALAVPPGEPPKPTPVERITFLD